MKIIHDNLWGDIELSDLAIQIIDTPHFQRLHYIKQTGFSYKVFPNSMTTRFQHSIGVYYVTKTLLQNLLQNQLELRQELNDRTIELLCIAGLLHDIGHGPYSHNFDSLLSQWLLDDDPWKHHEYRSCDIIRDLCQPNNEYNICISESEIEFIINRILGINSQFWYDNLINNKDTGIDCDKIDYLLRDSLNFGFQIKFDPFRIFKHIRVINNELSYCDRIQDEIITCFLIRNKMNKDIYRHRKITEFEYFYHKELNQNSKLRQKIIDICKYKKISEFIQLNDYQMIESLNWTPIECRKEKLDTKNQSKYIDLEWHKITRIKFYSKKNPSQNFYIQDWKIISCFS